MEVMKYRGIVRLNYLILFQVPRDPWGRDSVQLHSITILLNEVPISISSSVERLLRPNCLFTLVVRIDEQKYIKKWCQGKWAYASPNTSAKMMSQSLKWNFSGFLGKVLQLTTNFGDSMEKKLFPLREQQVSREEFLVVTCLYSGFPVW